MPRVLISAGHTVMDPGDVYGDLKEADLTRDIAKRIIPHLKQKGVIVMPVPLDLPLLQRIDWINNTGYKESLNDICLEIHINSGGKRGFEGWYKGQGHSRSQELVTFLLEEITKKTGYQSQGAHSEFEHELGSLSFLNRTNPTTGIIECLYLDSDEDIKILKDNSKLDELAKAIANAIDAYFKTGPGSKKAPANENKGDNASNAPTLATLPAPSAPTIPNYNPPPVSSFGGPNSALGASSMGFGGGNNFGSTPGLGGSNSPGLMQDREQRKDMIKKRYAQILGREPSQSDLNYFLNTGITEDQLIKKITESQEHLEIVKAKQELAKAKSELDQVKQDLIKYRSQAQESAQMLQQLEQALKHKNAQIAELQSQLHQAA